MRKAKLPRCVRLDAEHQFDSIGDGLAFARDRPVLEALDVSASGLLAFCSPDQFAAAHERDAASAVTTDLRDSGKATQNMRFRDIIYRDI